MLTFRRWCWKVAVVIMERVVEIEGRDGHWIEARVMDGSSPWMRWDLGWRRKSMSQELSVNKCRGRTGCWIDGGGIKIATRDIFVQGKKSKNK